jgi:NTE family protein
MSNYSFDTVEELLDTFEQWRKDREAYAACEGILARECPASGMPTESPVPVETYGIYIGFDQIKDTEAREYFLNLPTTFRLPAEAIDRLIEIGPSILDESEEFQRLVTGLRKEGD